METGLDKIKVLFLDIDGVLNRFKLPYVCEVEDEMINNLNYIIDKTGCKIVISSTWKASKKLMTILKNNLFPKLPVGCISDYTPTIRPQVNREQEIKLWLTEHPEVTSWVVVDDYDFELTTILDKCVITNALDGLTKQKAEECIRKLNHVN